MLRIADLEIVRVAIIDDEQAVREVYEDTITELGVTAQLERGPLPPLAECALSVCRTTQAAVCDHNLTLGTYSRFDGAELVAALYDSRFPAVLCTRWQGPGLDMLRRLRRRVPVVLEPDEMSPEAVVRGFEQCLDEFRGVLHPTRRLWRTQVNVEQVETAGKSKRLYVSIPAWNPNKVISLDADEVPGDIRVDLGTRLHAKVNTGAERQEELYFTDWENR